MARRGDNLIYEQVALRVSGKQIYAREYGNLVVTMDLNVGLIHGSGIVACSARKFLLDLIWLE